MSQLNAGQVAVIYEHFSGARKSPWKAEPRY